MAIIAALVLGGASQFNAPALATAELCCLPTLALGLWMTARTPIAGRAATPLCLLGATILLPCLQLLPLPPDLWTRLPGRTGIVEVMTAVGSPLGARPMSLTPEMTAHCALALIPPAAVFLITLQLDEASRRKLAGVIALLAGASLLLGLLQIAGGADSPLRLYERTDHTTAVGLFANKDHFADFLACAIPLAFAASGGPAGSSDRGVWARLAPALALSAVLIIGVAITASRAGLILLAVALPGALALAPFRQGGRRIALAMAASLGALIVAAMAVGRLPALERIAGAGSDLRFQAAPVVLQAVRAYWPLGSGVGSFIPIYQTFEPTRLVDANIFNHAHDDYLESLLESGLAAALIPAGFVIWFARRLRAAWRRPEARGAHALARAGSLIVLMILAHSAVDYPLRTVAMASLFAFACALLVPALPPAPAPDVGA